MLRSILLANCLALLLAHHAAASDWLFRRSQFTHDPLSGERVDLYAEKPPVYTEPRPGYFESGYRVNRSSLRGVGGSRDDSTVVESWGNGMGMRDAQSEREYDAWRRAYSYQGTVPSAPGYYPPYFGGPGFGYGGPGYGFPGYGYPGHPGSGWGGHGGGHGHGHGGHGGGGHGGHGHGGHH